MKKYILAITLLIFLCSCSLAPNSQATSSPTAAYTSAPTKRPTETIIPTSTRIPLHTFTPEGPQPTITVDPESPRSPEELANEGLHTYTYTAIYKVGCNGEPSGTAKIKFEFIDNYVRVFWPDITGERSYYPYYKIGENTYGDISPYNPEATTITYFFNLYGVDAETKCWKRHYIFA